jgi:hypothetical protein
MKSLALAVLSLTVAAGLPAANNSPLFRLAQATKNGKVQVTGRNVAKAPLVAYVVVAEHGYQRVVWNAVYTGQDKLNAGQKIMVGDIPADAASGGVKVFVDYVRLADGTTWGEAQTEQARTVISRFQK